MAQFQESDLAFASRLAEHAGISYFFDQSGGTDTMVFTDMASGFQPVPGAATIHYRGRGEERDVFDFEVRNAVVPGVFVVRDYNYRTPMVDLTAEHALPDGYAGGVIAWGDHYKTPGEGQQLAQIRAEERAAAAVVYAGKSTVCALVAGERSHGKGIAQSPLLAVAGVDDSTVARVCLPDGRSVHGLGVQPDVDLGGGAVFGGA